MKKIKINIDNSSCFDCIYYSESCSYYGPENECKLTGNMYFHPNGCKNKIPYNHYISLNKLEEIIKESYKIIIEI